MGLEARSLPADEGSALGRVVMVVILGDGSRNSIGGTAFHEVDHPGTKNINDLQDYRSAKDNEKNFKIYMKKWEYIKRKTTMSPRL